MSPEDRAKATSEGWAKMKAGAGYLYAAEMPDGVIKIGFALHPKRRLRELGGKLISTVRGTREQEMELHKKLSPFMIPSYGGRPGATEFYVPAVLAHGPVPEGFRNGALAHPEDKPKKKNRGPKADYAAIIAFHDGGRVTLQEVGLRFGLTKQRICQILAKHGVSERRGCDPDGLLPIEICRERVARYTAALKPGTRSKEALRIAGLTSMELRWAADRLGVPLPKPVRSERLRYREIADFYVAHPDLAGVDVARHFNVSEMTVSHALQRMGIYSRQSGWKRNRRPAEQSSPSASP